ncbi:MAG: UbiA family prenyltransferase [Thermodesulfobacteriota bacterium]
MLKSASDLSGFPRLRLYWALSRTPHGVIDMTTPGFAALMWLGEFPPFGIVLLGALTVFAGYTAVYALNDVVDYRVDRERLKQESFLNKADAPDLDAALVRHPLAQGLISFREGLFWSLSWAAVALMGAYILNPVCAAVFILGCILEAVYCLLLKVSPFRTLINGVVKALGPIAAVFAVDPSPSPLYLTTLFFMFFLWEIGGQNIPNDCTDLPEDRRLKAQTVPVRFGLDFSSFAVLATLLGAFFLSLILPSLSQNRFGLFLYITVAAAGIYLLIIPALGFHRRQTPDEAMTVFNKASYFPLALFSLVTAALLI